MPDPRRLVASETRDKLHAAVWPFVAATLDRLDLAARALAVGAAVAEIDGRRWRCATQVLLQYSPCVLRVMMLGLPKVVELERFGADEVPGLRDALDEVFAGVVSAMAPDHAAEVLGAAVACGQPGGLLAWFDLTSGDIRVFVAKAGEDLGRAIEVGSITTAPGTTH